MGTCRVRGLCLRGGGGARRHGPADGGCRRGRGRSPWPGRRWALGIHPFCRGLTSGSGPFPATPPPPPSLSTFNLTCSFHMEMGCKWGWGAAGASGCDLPAGPRTHVIPTRLGWPVVPGVRGSPLSPSDGADPFPCPGGASPLLSAEILGDGSLLGLSWRMDPRSPGLLVPPCPPATRAPPWQGQRAHPGEPRCTPCPVPAAAGDGSSALAGWGGGFQQDGHWSLVKSCGRGPLGYQMLPSASGAFARICRGGRGARGRGPGGRGLSCSVGRGQRRPRRPTQRRQGRQRASGAFG